MNMYSPPGTDDPTRISIATDPRDHRMTGCTYHKEMWFDVPYISQIADNLWQGGCQNGLVLPPFFKHIVSLYQWENYRIAHPMKSSLVVEMYDSLDQATGQVDAIANWVNTCVADGPTLVHCQAGLNRSSLVARRSLMLTGLSAADAIALLRANRSPACLCNEAFEAWLLAHDETPHG